MTPSATIGRREKGKIPVLHEVFDPWLYLWHQKRGSGCCVPHPPETAEGTNLWCWGLGIRMRLNPAVLGTKLSVSHLQHLLSVQEPGGMIQLPESEIHPRSGFCPWLPLWYLAVLGRGPSFDLSRSSMQPCSAFPQQGLLASTHCSAFVFNRLVSFDCLRLNLRWTLSGAPAWLWERPEWAGHETYH